ncbi:MAG: hypothetical protein ABJC13_25875 [Acidobacteriota bacterium]
MLSLFPGIAEHQLGCFWRLRRFGAELVLGGPGEKIRAAYGPAPTTTEISAGLCPRSVDPASGKGCRPTSRPFPLGLLTRAWLFSREGDPAAAHADLAEAQEIAERGPMPLYLADIALMRARLFGDRAALTEARRLIDAHGYGRRREDLADLAAEFG